MPPKKSQFKTVLEKQQQNKLINGRLANVKNASKNAATPQFVTVRNTRKGLFKCSKCEREWASRHSFVVVDLVNLCLSHDADNRQGCRRCKHTVPIDKWPTPCFKESWFKEMLDVVVTRMTSKGQKPLSSGVIPTRNHSRIPHRKDLCQKCISTKKVCWLSH